MLLDKKFRKFLYMVIMVLCWSDFIIYSSSNYLKISFNIIYLYWGLFVWRRAFCMVGQAFGFCLPNRINPHGALGSAWRVWTRGGRPRFSCNFFLYRQFLCFTYFFKDLGLKKRKFVFSRFCCVFIVSAVFFSFLLCGICLFLLCFYSFLLCIFF